MLILNFLKKFLTLFFILTICTGIVFWSLLIFITIYSHSSLDQILDVILLSKLNIMFPFNYISILTFGGILGGLVSFSYIHGFLCYIIFLRYLKDFWIKKFFYISRLTLITAVPTALNFNCLQDKSISIFVAGVLCPFALWAGSLFLYFFI